jgi:hypothetical protein
MKRYVMSVVALLLCTLPLLGQTVTMPAELKVDNGRLGSVLITYDGEDFRYVADSALDVFREYDPDIKKVRLRVIGYKDGTYTIKAIAVKGGKLGEFTDCKVIVGKPAPDPTPGPGPGPTPNPDPFGPEGKSKVGAALRFRCLIVYESSELGKMPPAQKAIIFTKDLRDYLNSTCVLGPDGSTKEWRIYDKDVDMSGETAVWQGVMKRNHPTIPWIVIGNGKTGFEGPLPATVEDTLALLKKYAA